MKPEQLPHGCLSRLAPCRSPVGAPSCPSSYRATLCGLDDPERHGSGRRARELLKSQAVDGLKAAAPARCRRSDMLRDGPVHVRCSLGFLQRQHARIHCQPLVHLRLDTLDAHSGGHGSRCPNGAGEVLRMRGEGQWEECGGGEGQEEGCGVQDEAATRHLRTHAH